MVFVAWVGDPGASAGGACGGIPLSVALWLFAARCSMGTALCSMCWKVLFWLLCISSFAILFYAPHTVTW